MPELTEGPYYLDLDLVRSDMTEGRPGVPLDLRVNVVDAGSCAPIEGAAVDVWHCDAEGVYSGVEGAEGETFCRDAVEPYAARGEPDQPNESDGSYRRSGGVTVVAVTLDDESSGSVMLGIDRA